jgi:hypothetical protein
MRNERDTHLQLPPEQGDGPPHRTDALKLDAVLDGDLTSLSKPSAAADQAERLQASSEKNDGKRNF